MLTRSPAVRRSSRIHAATEGRCRAHDRTPHRSKIRHHRWTTRAGYLGLTFPAFRTDPSGPRDPRAAAATQLFSVRWASVLRIGQISIRSRESAVSRERLGVRPLGAADGCTGELARRIERFLGRRPELSSQLLEDQRGRDPCRESTDRTADLAHSDHSQGQTYTEDQSDEHGQREGRRTGFAGHAPRRPLRSLDGAEELDQLHRHTAEGTP